MQLTIYAGLASKPDLLSGVTPAHPLAAHGALYLATLAIRHAQPLRCHATSVMIPYWKDIKLF